MFPMIECKIFKRPFGFEDRFVDMFIARIRGGGMLC